MSPKRPTHISDWAVTCLESLAREGLGALLSLGGALGLMHYLDYRDTHDIGAWWTPGASGAETHLERIAKHRPLEQIEDIGSRAEAETLRSWYRTEFLDAIRD